MAIHAVPVPSEPPADEQPKRGRGRPRKDPTDASPVRRGTRGPAVTEDAVGGLLFMFNIPLSVFGPTRNDALDPVEITVLSKGIVEQCKSSPAFKRYVQMALKMSGATGVITPLAFIIGRRAARHGLLPGGAEADAQMGKMIGVLAGTVSLSEFMPDMSTLPENPDAEPTPFAPPQPVPANAFTEPVD